MPYSLITIPESTFTGYDNFGIIIFDFQKITESLASIDFYGPIVLEANIRNSFETDVRASVQYLRPILARP